MGKRIYYSEDQKKELIEEYKPQYLSSKKSLINKQKATEESFNNLTFKEQWKIIYVNYVLKVNKSVPADIKPTKKFTYNDVRSAINNLKKYIDVMNSEQIDKMFTELEELQKLVDTKAERAKKVELQKLEMRKMVLLDELKEIEELEKTLSE